MLPLLLVMQALPFTVAHNRDPITDREAIAALATAENGDAITIVCFPHKQELRVAFTTKGRYLMRTGWLNSAQPLTYRFDSRAPVTSDWFYDEHVAQILESGSIIPFLRQLVSAQKLVVRAHNYEGDNIDATFSTAGAKPAIRDVVAACGKTKVAQALAADLG